MNIEKIKKIILNYLNLKEFEGFSENTELYSDLDLNEADIMEMCKLIEKELNITIGESWKDFKTVGDIINFSINNQRDDNFLGNIDLSSLKSFTTDEVERVVQAEKKEKEKKSFFGNHERKEKNKIINKVLLLFLLFSVIFIYFYYASDMSFLKNGSSLKDSISSNLTPVEENTTNKEEVEEINDKKEVPEDNINQNIEEIIESLVYEIRDLNEKDVERVRGYIDLKNNRHSTVSFLKENKRRKEEIYREITLIGEDENSFRREKRLIIQSIAMNEEFLEAFNRSSASRLFELLKKYENK